MQNNPIKLAGIACDWSEVYAKKYAEQLMENGFYAKITNFNNKWYVAYCYRSFTKIEYEKVLNDLFGGDDKHE